MFFTHVYVMNRFNFPFIYALEGIVQKQMSSLQKKKNKKQKTKKQVPFMTVNFYKCQYLKHNISNISTSGLIVSLYLHTYFNVGVFQEKITKCYFSCKLLNQLF